MSEEQTLNFEKAFERLEAILNKMNSGKVPLDDSLKLYEEADQLIQSCSTRLTRAEKRIETLVKQRSGELVTDEANTPKTQRFDVEEAVSQS